MAFQIPASYTGESRAKHQQRIGFRTRLVKGLQWEMTAFSTWLSNQVIPVSESSGGTGSGLVNGERPYTRGIRNHTCYGYIQVVELVNHLWWPMSMPTGWMPVLKEIAPRGQIHHRQQNPICPWWLVNGALYPGMDQWPRVAEFGQLYPAHNLQINWIPLRQVQMEGSDKFLRFILFYANAYYTMSK